MKTVFQRVMSVIMCVILIAGTMSTMAFAADGEFRYDQYMDNSKESIAFTTTGLLNEVDEILEEANLNEQLKDLEELGIELDLSSVDGILATIDDLRFAIGAATLLLPIGDLKDLELKYFEKNMTRAKSGDIKIISELLELISSNGKLVSKFLDGTIDLGAVGDLLELDMSTILGDGGFAGILKEAFVSVVYEADTPEFKAACETVKTDFDAFLFGDFVGKIVPIEGFEIDTDVTVSGFLTSVCSILVDEYVIDFLKGFKGNLTGSGLEALEGKLNLLGSSYDYTNIKIDPTKSVTAQINNFFGAILSQMVPGYTWVEGDYTKLDTNVIGILRYLAVEAGVEGAATMERDPLITTVINKVLSAITFKNGTEKLFENFEKCDTFEEMATMFFINLGKTKGITTTYTASQNYEHVIGDLLIKTLEDDVIIADASGKKVEVGNGVSGWNVWNYVLNFFLNDKDIDALLNKDGKLGKSTTAFNKMDIFCDMFANDGTSSFATQTYFTGLINDVLDFNLTALLTDTVKKLENYGGNTSIVEFIYKGVYAFAKNWAGQEMLVAYDASGPFQKAVSNEAIGQLVESALTALGGYKMVTAGLFGGSLKGEYVAPNRGNALCGLLGLLISTSPKISVADVVYTGSAVNPTVKVVVNGKTLTKGKDYTVSVAADGIGEGQVTVSGTGGMYVGETTTDFNVVLGKISGLTYTPAQTGVTLKWNKLAGAKSYNVYLGSKLIKNVTTNSLAITGLKNGVKNDYTVEAVAADGSRSAKATVKTVTLPGNVSGLKATSPSNTKVTLTWNKAAGAAGYYVQNAGKTIATVYTNAATISASPNTTYQLRVIPFSTSNASEKKSGNATAAVTIRTAPNAPLSVAKKSVTSKTATISWRAVTGAAGYSVEIYNGGWKVLGTTKSTSYTAKNLKGNTAYKFRVRAYSTLNGKNYYSAYSSQVSATTISPAPTGLTFKSATSTSVTISWNAVSGASGYQIYFYNGGWKKISTTKRSYTIKSLKANKSYKVKVRAYKGSSSKVYGDFTSEITTSTAPAKVTLSKVKAGKKSITPSWKKVSGAAGYELQYSTSSKFKSKKTVKITSGSTVKKQIKKLKKGKKYYVRVRAYKVVNGKTLYGSYSSTKYTKAK